MAMAFPGLGNSLVVVRCEVNLGCQLGENHVTWETDLWAYWGGSVKVERSVHCGYHHSLEGGPRLYKHPLLVSVAT